MISNPLQHSSNHPGALIYTRTHSRQSYLLQSCIESMQVETDSVAEVDTLGCPCPWFNEAPLIPPHFKNCRTLAVETLIDIVGQNWFGIARPGTPLQQTVVQRGPFPRWPQLSRVAWARENVSVFPSHRSPLQRVLRWRWDPAGSDRTLLPPL